MNAYVRDRLAGAIVGVNAFQIRRDPIQIGFIDDEAWKQIQRRPIIAPEDVGFIARAVPDAEAIALQSGWPTPMADVQWRNRTTGDVFIFGVTAPAMLRAEEAMRIAHRLRPGADNDFTIDTGEGLIAFWAKLTRVIFTVVPAVVVIGIVVGGIVIMNIMLMSVTERTREIGIRKALGAARRDIRRQFFAEALTLSVLGGIAGLAVGAGLAGLVQVLSPLPARVTGWSIGIALLLGIVVGVAFGVYPAHRASRLDPIEALRQE